MMPVYPDPPSRRRWPWQGATRGRLLVQMLIALCIVSVPMTWVLVNYEGQNLNQTYTMSAVDGWCDAPTEGLGVHCFGDFQLGRILLQDPENVWTNEWGVPHPGTPLGMVPHQVTNWLAQTPLGVQGSLYIYLALMVVALVVPAAAVAYFGGAGVRGLLPFLVIGVATLPFLAALDRGSSVGFVVPLLLAFAWTLRRGPTWIAPTAVVLASAFRPQYALLAIAFLALARFRAFAATVATAVAIQLVTFAVWPGGFAQTFDRWWTNINRYGSYVAITGDGAPSNLSASRALVIAAGWVAHLPTPLGSFGKAVGDYTVAHPAVPGYALVTIAAIIMIVARRRIPYPVVVVTTLALPALLPAVSFIYYIVFVLVVAALLIGPIDWPWSVEGDDGPSFGLVDAMNGRVGTTWAWATMVATALSLFPLTITAGENRQAVVTEYLGFAWFLVVVLGLAWSVVLWARARRATP